MASNSDDGDDDLVVLKCNDPHRTDPEADLTEIFVSTAEICSWDLVSILTHEIVTVKASRNRQLLLLVHLRFCFQIQAQKISYFCSNCVSLTGSSNIPRIFVVSFAEALANDFIPELCTSYLARNFVCALLLCLAIIYSNIHPTAVHDWKMWAIYCNSFPYVPDNLLVSSIKHPDLTIDSERHLANAFIVWLSASTGQFESLGSTRNDWSGILEELRGFGHVPIPPSAPVAKTDIVYADGNASRQGEGQRELDELKCLSSQRKRKQKGQN
ncbi:hypothetical protein Acr_15g0010900 [Actinidia rufa]|uniref:Uncharacterized protein n=1 Tax=Actinidia rufa TaxID=165716 RepID=A0A7J0FUV3_9ERIC|nr:hypothetical protein Acr_15g0010900 [Actinidia rufa]